jgi:hypothetical protein
MMRLLLAAAALAVAAPAGAGIVIESSPPHSVVLGEGSSPAATTGPGSAGDVLTSNGDGADPSFQPPPTHGTVTSLNVALPAQFICAGGPITTTGTITCAWEPGPANEVLATPNGAGGTPSLRLLAPADIPSLLSLYDAAGAAGAASATAQSNAETFASSAAATAQSNAEAFSANAANLTSGTVATARLPVGSASALGVLEVGNGLSVSAGVVSVAGGAPASTYLPLAGGTITGPLAVSGATTLAGLTSTSDIVATNSASETHVQVINTSSTGRSYWLISGGAGGDFAGGDFGLFDNTAGRQDWFVDPAGLFHAPLGLTVTGTAAATTFSGSGAGLTNLPAGGFGSAAASLPTAPASTSAFTMQGLAGSITPKLTGDIQITISGTIEDIGPGASSLAGTGIAYSVRFGAGAAPANGAAAAGVTCAGGAGGFQLHTGFTYAADVEQPFVVVCQVTGLPLNVAEWIDIAAESIGSASAMALTGVSIAAFELH